MARLIRLAGQTTLPLACKADARKLSNTQKVT